VPGAAPQPAAVKAAKRPGDPLSDDDIDDLLSTPDSRSSTVSTSSAGDDDAEDATDDEPRARQKNARFEKEDLDADDEEDSSRRKKKGKSSTPPESKADSAHSADIARHLMGRGDKPAVDEHEKKTKRPFGGEERRREGEITSLKDVFTYFAKVGWPYLLGFVVVIGGCVWFVVSMMKSLDLPPLAPVSGRITVDGKPLSSAIVKFVPEAGTTNLRLATSIGITDKDGNYSLIYAADVGGAVIGKHQVQVQLNDPTGAQLIAPEYSTAKSTLTADVKKGAPPFNFDIPSASAATTGQ
jgi:hypothetical protein